MENEISSGTLYVVATPIGNLEDITYRAVRILKHVDLIAAEDTRHSKKLLSHLDIPTRLVSCHEHNETQKAPQLIKQLKEGQNIALISDAGTPCISDPGYTLVSEAAKEKIPIIPIPGCSAAITGLSVSGLPTDAFLFIGFLPKKKQKQQQTIQDLSNQKATLIIYESPRRIIPLIEQLKQILGDRNACLGREITKLHEEFIRGTFSDIHKILQDKPSVKGECSLFVQGNIEKQTINDTQLKAILIERIKTGNIGTSKLAKQVASEFNLSKKSVYDMILTLSTDTFKNK